MAKKNKNKDLDERLILVIRVRGSAKINYKIEDTLKMLRLHKPNHAIVAYASKSVLGMLNKVKDYVAYGDIDEDVLVKLLRNRALVRGNKPLTELHLKNKAPNTPTIESLAKALIDGKIQVKDVYNLKPIFRLHPPRGGYRGTIKKPYNAGGTLGFVGKAINSMVLKMI